jgi:lipopolysaccharide export system permease protein
MVVLLAGLAIPLSHTTPRQSHYFKIVIGILIYLIYNNLLSIFKKWVEREEISPWLGIGWVHLGLLLIILILFNFSKLKLKYRYWVSWLFASRKS